MPISMLRALSSRDAIRHTVLALLMASLVPSPLTAAASQTPIELPKERRWLELTTPHFVLYGDASKRTMRGVGRDLERLRSVLAQMTSLDLAPQTPVLVFVFRGDSSFDPYRHRLSDGQPAKIGGAFYRRRHASFVSLNAAHGLDVAGATIRHEYVHFFVANNMPSIPVWFDEGLAEYYSTFEASDDTAYVGKADFHNLARARQQQPLSLREVLAVDRSSPIYNESEHKGAFYAQSWLLTHYLLLGNPDRQSQLFAYLKLREEKTIDEAFAAAFGIDYGVLEAELRAYMRQPTMPYIRIDLPSVDGGDDLSLREVGRAEVLARLGEFLAIQNRAADATLHLRAALDLDASQPRAHIGLGIVAERSDDLEAAIDHYRRALTVDPSVTGARFLLANARARRGHDITTLIDDLHEVVQASPRFATAWNLLGRAIFVSDAEIATKISILTKALELSPDDEHHAERLLRLYLRSDDPAKAEQLIATYFRPRGIDPGPILDEETVSGRGGSWTVAEADDLDATTIELPTGDSPKAVAYRERWSEAEHLVREQHYADAATVLESMLETWPTDVQLHSRLDVVQRAAFAQQLRQRNAEVATRFRLATEHFEQGRYQEAESLLRALYRDAAEFPHWRQRIESLIGSVEAAREARSP